MSPAETVLWVAAAFVAYPYLIYPLWLFLVGRILARPTKRQKGFRPSVSFVTCVYNEAGRIERRLAELVSILDGTDVEGEIVVVSDGSTDDTVALVRRHSDPRIRLLELPRRGGKAAALTAGGALATGEILVFCDVRQTWAPDALELLLENFADERVGAVSGELIVMSGPGAVSGVGLYWKLEKWMRRQESRFGSQVGVTGAISAVRRELFQPIPQGTMLDDVYWPLAVAMKGRRVIHDSRALAYDRLPERAGDEFRRKVRTLAGNFQLLTRLPSALLPWRNPTWFVLLSHKLARLVVPWALLTLFVACWFADGPLYVVLLLAQIVCYGLALAGLMTKRGGKLTSVPASFVVLNAAAWAAFWVWVAGRADRSWVKVSYDNKQIDPPTVGREEASAVS
jgi:cellulose synthase/poly-beta-1,6-N-acetylglucosamine synthase-like glycosyltransferase